MNAAARIITIIAEHGTSMAAPVISPAKQASRDMADESGISTLRRWENTSAVIIGRDIIDMSSMMPTSLMVNIMQTATNTVMV